MFMLGFMVEVMLLPLPDVGAMEDVMLPPPMGGVVVMVPLPLPIGGVVPEGVDVLAGGEDIVMLLPPPGAEVLPEVGAIVTIVPFIDAPVPVVPFWAAAKVERRAREVTKSFILQRKVLERLKTKKEFCLLFATAKYGTC